MLLKLRDTGTQVHVGKCESCVSSTKYLGMIISRDGIKMDPEKFGVVSQSNTPRRATEVYFFIEFFNLYRRLIEGVFNIVGYLKFLWMEGTLFQWTEKCDRAFDKLKRLFCKYSSVFAFRYSRDVESGCSDFWMQVYYRRRARMENCTRWPFSPGPWIPSNLNMNPWKAIFSDFSFSWKMQAWVERNSTTCKSAHWSQLLGIFHGHKK